MNKKDMFYGAVPQRFEQAKDLRRRMTPAEEKLWERLNKNQLFGYRFRRQHPLGNFIADFYCHPLKLVVEVDGGVHNLPDQMEYDQGRTYELDQLGVNVIRFTNEEVEQHIDNVVERIKERMALIAPQPPGPLKGETALTSPSASDRDEVPLQGDLGGTTQTTSPFRGPGGVFLTPSEKKEILTGLQNGHLLLNRFFTALEARVNQRVNTPGVLGLTADAAWWYPAAEYISDAAMVYALKPSEPLKIWLRDTTLAIARRPEADWVGPWFRDHSEPFTGHLETAHLCWALAAAYDLARDVFSAEEQEEVAGALSQKGIKLCRRWLSRNSHLANWRGIMSSGVVVAAAALGDEELLNQYLPEIILCAGAFQPDGSYAESLQYGNYLAFALMMAYEALHRRYPEQARQLKVAAYAQGLPWVVSSMLYQKPLAGWGEQPRARAANFNDSAATFRPSGDLLLHVAARCQSTLPTEAGLARWLFGQYYVNVPTQKPDNLATFGLRNDWGFLTLPLLVQSPDEITPETADLPLTSGFSNGNAFIRDSWSGKTVLAFHGGGEALYGPGHLHGDLNSFILVHNRERLLVDPGHSCYRNLIHGLESSSQTHNTCTFLIEQDSLGLQEDLAKAKLLEQQSLVARRRIIDGRPASPVDRGARRLVLVREGQVSVVGSEAGKLYGSPIQEFSRFCIQCGSHVLFVVDRIRSSSPVTTLWNWLLNNRDGESDIQVVAPNELRMLRGEAGLRLFPTGPGTLSGPVYGYVHDAYHTEPNQLGEGRPGSGWLYRWTEPKATTFRTVVHALVVDDYGLVRRWELKQEEGITLSNGTESWTLHLSSTERLDITISDQEERKWRLSEQEGSFQFSSKAI